MRLTAISFKARKGNTYIEQSLDCIGQLNDYFDTYPGGLNAVISLIFFMNVDNDEEYYSWKKNIISFLPSDIRTKIPSAYLAQPPANHAKIALEVHYLFDPVNVKLTPGTESGLVYLVAEDEAGKKMVIANGICQEKPSHSIRENSEYVFGIMEKILHKVGLVLNAIFRQWNYIQGITEINKQNQLECQHYQQFNDVRSRFYSTVEFQYGYPAATGIGTRAGGVIVSFYASDPEKMEIKSIENPLQKAAFEYSDTLLPGTSAYNYQNKATPKFSRAKFLKNSLSSQIFVSGTASIREEKTVAENDVIKQTEITIENIQKLIHPETYSKLTGNNSAKPSIDFYRVYIKNVNDYEVVKKICENRFPGAPNIFVVSDICRENLLIEIELISTTVYGTSSQTIHHPMIN